MSTNKCQTDTYLFVKNVKRNMQELIGIKKKIEKDIGQVKRKD
jgi:hypothetical protein